MKIIKTTLPDVLLIEPKVIQDERGFFFEAYNQHTFKNAGLDYTFVQDNHSKSSYGTLRGLHYQLEPMAQTKLVRVLQGRVFDVAVDLRQHSPTYKQWTGHILSSETPTMMLIPKGFGHGFLVLSATAEFLYKCDNFYSPTLDRSLQWNDNDINIKWPIKDDMTLNLSKKDMAASKLKDADLFS